MRDFREVDDMELSTAKPWRLGCEALASLVAGALCLVAAGVLFGVYSVAAGHF